MWDNNVRSVGRDSGWPVFFLCQISGKFARELFFADFVIVLGYQEGSAMIQVRGLVKEFKVRQPNGGLKGFFIRNITLSGRWMISASM